MSEIKSYIGDGVYVDIENFHIVLTVEDGLNKLEKVYLDPQVWSNLKRFVERIGDPNFLPGEPRDLLVEVQGWKDRYQKLEKEMVQECRDAYRQGLEDGRTAQGGYE